MEIAGPSPSTTGCFLLSTPGTSAPIVPSITSATSGLMLEAAIKAVLPDFDTITTQKVADAGGGDSLTFYYAAKGGQPIGVAIKSYTNEGFSGNIEVMVGLLDDGTISNTAVLSHKETPGLGDKMDKAKSDFPDQFMGKNPADYTLKVTKDGGEVDAITAATISSRAFCDAVQRAYDTYEKEK